ncbi:MAG: ABC transporter ATP-binding protein [Desulfarculus sp.]|nr:ABC transporter ATP-binding protein [Pseudomonadota bacterium]MBU4600268.1 ABC transporter ATP-binding protein [Pseudomonadota bacterium]MBV1715916.1 ABC transporter ATP-binding protein [Desulfarculus sp.]MBV1738642.1 ABC transporter ATP-binding protein [Desulfarculus sp.]
MLRVESISFAYGRQPALREVSLKVNPGEVVSLLGMNGAGKTTLLGVISGLLKPKGGRVTFENRQISGLSPSAIVETGVVQVPEGRQLFGPLTVKENLELGSYVRLRKHQAKAVAEDLKRALALFPVLAQRLEQPAGTLSGGEQQMLAMARGLMARPRLLLLDEPSLGLAPQVAAEILGVVRDLPAQGCSVLLVEQNALGALSVSQRGYIITGGRIRQSGSPKEILADELLREAFLGPRRAFGGPKDKTPEETS